MFFVAAVDPAADDTCRHRVLECIFEVFHDNLLVVIINHDERCLAEILVAYGDFSGHYVRQGVNKGCRAGEEASRVLNRRLIMRVGLQRRVSVEQDDGAVLTRLETSVSLNI